MPHQIVKFVFYGPKIKMIQKSQILSTTFHIKLLHFQIQPFFDLHGIFTETKGQTFGFNIIIIINRLIHGTDFICLTKYVQIEK